MEIVKVDQKRTGIEEGIQSHRSWGRAEVQMVQNLPMPDSNVTKHEKVAELEDVQVEDVQVVPGHPEQTIRVASDLPGELKQSLATCLAHNKVIFTSSPQEVRGISPKVMEHRLNIFPELKQSCKRSDISI